MSVTYIEVKREDCHNYAGHEQAAHCMVYARLPNLKFLETFELRAAVLVSIFYLYFFFVYIESIKMSLGKHFFFLNLSFRCK